MTEQNAAVRPGLIPLRSGVTSRGTEAKGTFLKWLRSWASVALARLLNALAGPVR